MHWLPIDLEGHAGNTRNGGWLFAMLWKSLAWGLCTAVASALATLAVFVFIVPRLVDNPRPVRTDVCCHGGPRRVLHRPTARTAPPNSHGTPTLAVAPGGSHRVCPTLRRPGVGNDRCGVQVQSIVSGGRGDAHPICRLSKLTATEYRSLSGQCPGGQLTTLSAVGSVRQSA